MCLLVAVGVIGGQIWSNARGGTIYSTGFDDPPFSPSTRQWAGVDGWYSSDPTNGSVAVLQAGEVYIGYTPPAGSHAFVARDFSFDPVGSKQPIVKIHTNLEFAASTNGHSDAFAFVVTNANGNYICSLYFDNGTGNMYFDNGNANLQPLPYYYFAGYLLQFDLEIDFSTGLATATLTGTTGITKDLFRNQKLNVSGSALNFGTVGYLWMPTNPSAPGNNFMMVDALSIDASPAPSLVLVKGTVHHVTGPNFIIRGGQAAEDNVRVEWRTKKHHQWTPVRGTSTSWLVPVRPLVKGRNLVDVRLLNANDVVIDQKRVVIIRK